MGKRKTGGDPEERDRPKGPEGNLEEVLVGITKVWVRRSRSGETRWGCEDEDAGGAAEGQGGAGPPAAMGPGRGQPGPLGAAGTPLAEAAGPVPSRSDPTGPGAGAAAAAGTGRSGSPRDRGKNKGSEGGCGRGQARLGLGFQTSSAFPYPSNTPAPSPPEQNTQLRVLSVMPENTAQAQRWSPEPTEGPGVISYSLQMIRYRLLALGTELSGAGTLSAPHAHPQGPTHLVHLPLLFWGATPPFRSGSLAWGVTEVKVRVTETAVSVDIVQALPHHLLLLQKALVSDQKVQVAL